MGTLVAMSTNSAAISVLQELMVLEFRAVYLRLQLTLIERFQRAK